MGNDNSRRSKGKGSDRELMQRFGTSKDELKDLKKLYRDSCGGNKYLSREQFRSVYRKLFPGDVTEFAEIMFNKFDSDRSGYVDMREFLIGLLASDSNNKEEQIKFAFDMYDLDKNGAISMDEVTQIFHAYRRMYNCTDDEDMARSLFKLMDKNADEEITFEEFNEAAKSNPEVINLLFPKPPE